MNEKRYRAERTPTGVQVYVVQGGCSRPLRHVVLHSPTGFEYGYGGSGPADLALSILADYFGERPTRQQLSRGACKCWQHHQAFKCAFIAPARGAGFEISSATIADWLDMCEQATARAACASCDERLSPDAPRAACARCEQALCELCHTASPYCRGCDVDEAVEQLERHRAALNLDAPDDFLEADYEDRVSGFYDYD